MTALAALLSIFWSIPAQAKTLTIEMGDTVTWLPSAKGHNVHIRKGPDGAKLPKKSRTSKKFSMTFKTSGIYFYWCTPHKVMGTRGLIIVDNDMSNLDIIAESKTKGQSTKKLSELIAHLR